LCRNAVVRGPVVPDMTSRAAFAALGLLAYLKMRAWITRCTVMTASASPPHVAARLHSRSGREPVWPVTKVPITDGTLTWRSQPAAPV